MSENLENIWKDSTSDVSGTVRDTWWSYIYKKYNETGRNCHNYEFLMDKFKEFQNISQLIKNAQAFILALFFQYLEYSPNDSESHEKNLKSFNKFATEAGISNDCDLYKDVVSLLEGSSIHSTEEHKTEGAYGDSDLHYFLDLDMSVLGSSESDYDKYKKSIQSEYSTLDESTYNNLRKKVLQSFLLIPNIFATKEFRNKYETQARKNIEEELKALMKP